MAYNDDAKQAMHIKVKKGALHAALGKPQGQPLSTSMLEKKKASTKSSLMKKRITFALNARKWNHG